MPRRHSRIAFPSAPAALYPGAASGMERMLSMIGRLVRFTGSTKSIEDLERELLDKCLDEVRALPRLAALHTMVDRQGGELIVLAVWEDTAAADRAMDAMVPIRHQILAGGIEQSMRDYQIVGDG